MNTKTDAGHVARRATFYIPGFDPLSARRYRELYRTEAAKQAAICGYDLHVEGTPGKGAYGWRTAYSEGNSTTETAFTFLGWNDLVRGAMDVPIWQMYWWALTTSWLYLRSGALLRLIRLRWAPMLVALFPVVILALYLLGGLLLAAGAVWGISLMGVPWWAGVPLGAGLIAFVLIYSRRRDQHVFAYYLMADYAFTASEQGRMPAALRARLDEFVAQVEAACASDVDEVLIVGHSSGAHIAVQLVAELLRRGQTRPLSLLTLGEVVPMVSFLPGASDLRRDLHEVSRAEAVFWLDVTAPGDGGSFALCDPVCVTGVAPPDEQKHNPKVISAKFRMTMDAARLKSMRWMFFRKHIQYLCAFEHPLDYDYFRISAGDKTLRDRFAWRGSTASRIERAMSPHRDF